MFFLKWLILLCLTLACYFVPPAQTVSVVMPVYNREKLVARAIDSILAQTFTNFELIIVDDGSTDSTADVLKDYAARDKRIRILTHSQNKGIAHARNTGLFAARGKYIAPMDSDDYALPNRLAKTVLFLEQHPGVVAVTGKISLFQNQLPTVPAEESSYNNAYTLEYFPGYKNAELLFENLFQNIASLYRKNFVLKNHIAYNTTFIAAEDYDFWLQFIKHNGVLASIKETLSYIHQHTSNSDEYYQAMKENSKQIHKQVFSWFFTPSDKEISLIYTLPERCLILQKLKQANTKKNVIRHLFLEAYSKKMVCPDSDNWVFLSHPAWPNGALFEWQHDSSYKRTDTKVSYHIDINGNDLVLTDANGLSDTFTMADSQIYRFNPHQKTIRLMHNHWQDNLNLNEQETAACRAASTTECARISFQNDKQILIVEWIRWDKETFLFDKVQNAYVLKP